MAQLTMGLKAASAHQLQQDPPNSAAPQCGRISLGISRFFFGLSLGGSSTPTEAQLGILLITAHEGLRHSL